MDNAVKIRPASIKDAADIRKIYAPYVSDTAITFEYDIPDEAEFAGSIKKTLEKYPYLVAEKDGRIIGYAYAGTYRTRAAYSHTVEMSVYLEQSSRGQGCGRMLYEELERILKQQNIYILYACITSTDRENDGYLTDASIHFHEKMGYRHIGKNEDCGYKFGRWYSVLWMEKVIAQRPEKPQDFLPYPKISPSPA